MSVSRPLAAAEVRSDCAHGAYPLAYAVGRPDLLRDAPAYFDGGRGDLQLFHEALLQFGGLPTSLIRWGLEASGE